MMTRYISHLMLGLSLVTFHQSTVATQGTTPNPLSQDCLNQLETVVPPLPTVKEMLNVDPIQVPWGINLSLVEEFGSRFRKTKGLGDECNVAPRITNYQKNLSDIKKSEVVIPIIQDMIDSVTLNTDTSLKKLEESKANNQAKSKEQQQIKHDKEVALRPLVEKMNKLKRDKELAEVGIDKNKNNYKIMRTIGLTPEQIAKLPDLDTWKAMKKELPPQRPQTPLPTTKSQQAEETPQRPTLPPQQSKSWRRGKTPQ